MSPQKKNLCYFNEPINVTLYKGSVISIKNIPPRLFSFLVTRELFLVNEKQVFLINNYNINIIIIFKLKRKFNLEILLFWELSIIVYPNTFLPKFGSVLWLLWLLDDINVLNTINDVEKG